MSTEKRSYELKVRAKKRDRTRERIAKAAAELHERNGVAGTTVAEIARRAGVQRVTVYNHFPTLEELLPACAAHYQRLHPLPDLGPAFSMADPRDRVEAVLAALYGWYRETDVMTSGLMADRGSVPELDAFMRENSDALLAELGRALAGGFGVDGAAPERLRALIAVALSFWTWRRLDQAGLDDHSAASLMADSVAGAGAAPAGRREARTASR